jgi:hypothetical protein
VNAIWASKSCNGCHSGLSGSPPLNLNGSAATNLASINGTAGVINATVDNSYLLSCPSANSANPAPTVLCPYPAMTSVVRIAANPPSTEYSAIQQWISDGVLGP